MKHISATQVNLSRPEITYGDKIRMSFTIEMPAKTPEEKEFILEQMDAAWHVISIACMPFVTGVEFTPNPERNDT